MSMTRRMIKKTAGSRGRSGLSRKEKMSRGGVRAAQVQRSGVIKNNAPRGGVVRCEGCSAIWYDKHWHSPLVVEHMKLATQAVGLCDECHRAGQNAKGAVSYAGEITLDGEFAPKEKEEILALVRNIGKRAMKRDPEDRVVRIAEAGGAIKIFTSDNQLAVAIGKQIHDARKGGELRITWSRTDLPVRVHWTK